jgi:predicted glycosyltransferase involved in capsule biosynthesis
MTKNNETYAEFFLENIKNFSQVIDAFNVLAISSLNEADTYKVIEKNKSEFIDFFKNFLSQIELVFEENSKSQFDINSDQLLNIRQSISEINLNPSEFLETILNGIDLIVDFIALTKDDSYKMIFSKSDLEEIRREVIILKGELFS